MATTFLLVRHAAHDLLGKAVAGRASGLSLNAHGRHEALQLAERLSSAPIAAVYSGPLERVRETAAPLAHRLGIVLRVDMGLHEIDFGAWTGRTFTELESTAEWPVWVYRRSEAEPPGGETILAVQRRIIETIERLRRAHEGETVALVSHGDVIKAALASYLGVSLDALERFDIAPASVSAVVAGDGWSKVTLLNGLAYR